MTEESRPYKCNMCDNIGFRQNCKEHKTIHGHGLVHLKTQHKGMNAWWLCNACSEREQ